MMLDSNRKSQQHHTMSWILAIFVLGIVHTNVVCGFTINPPPVLVTFASTLAKNIIQQPPKTKTTPSSVIAPTPTTIASESEPEPIILSNVVTRVAVAGATGKTGQYVVQELLKQNVSEVVAIVRNITKAESLFLKTNGNDSNNRLKIVLCDFNDEQQVNTALKGCDAAIWCATGFSAIPNPTPTPTPNPNPSIIEKLQSFFGLLIQPQQQPSQKSPQQQQQQSIDLIGLPAVAKALVSNQRLQNDKVLSSSSTDDNSNDKSKIILPKLIMCSSAGVTRPGWSTKKKEKYTGVADIPIVRLNPFNILQRKLESESLLRSISSSNDNTIVLLPYTIVRPCGLNDNWPINSRPIFTQGDVAVGRCSRYDLATTLVQLLTSPAAVQKTFEMITIAGYTSSTSSINNALQRLTKDVVGVSSSNDDGTTIQLPYDTNYNSEITEISYQIMQQLLPGEKQDSAALAMGQTYEQLDSNTQGRLGVRGQEDISNVIV